MGMSAPLAHRAQVPGGSIPALLLTLPPGSLCFLPARSEDLDGLVKAQKSSDFTV